MAGIAFSEEGMGVSMFHTAAIAMVDWMTGLEDDVAGVGSGNKVGRGLHEDDAYAQGATLTFGNFSVDAITVPAGQHYSWGICA